MYYTVLYCYVMVLYGMTRTNATYSINDDLTSRKHSRQRAFFASSEHKLLTFMGATYSFRSPAGRPEQRSGGT